MQDYTNRFLLETLKLPVLENLNNIGITLGLSSPILLLMAKNNKKFYTQFSIPKKDGTLRNIVAPKQKLKLVQRWILENILYDIPISEQAMAFRKTNKYGIKSNAYIHKDSLYLLEIDLEDFFTSIKRKDVFYIFRNLGYNKFVSNWLANICTYDGYLPQGAVTSPHISNIICKGLDKRILGLCSKREVNYSRYADDMTFSCDNKETLKRIYKIIKSIVEDEGFRININKTRFLSPPSHKHVTGITIHNEELKASKKLKRKVRAMIHTSIATQDYSNNNKILGYVAYINYIEDGYILKVKKYIDKLINSYFKYNEDIIREYNKNHLYKDLKLQRTINIDIEDLRWYEDEDEELYNMFIENIDQNNKFRVNRGYNSLDIISNEFGLEALESDETPF